MDVQSRTVHLLMQRTSALVTVVLVGFAPLAPVVATCAEATGHIHTSKYIHGVETNCKA